MFEAVFSSSGLHQGGVGCGKEYGGLELGLWRVGGLGESVGPRHNVSRLPLN